MAKLCPHGKYLSVDCLVCAKMFELDDKREAELTRLRAQQTVLVKALTKSRKCLLLYMEGEGFNQDTDNSPILGVIDEALATLDVPEEL